MSMLRATRRVFIDIDGDGIPETDITSRVVSPIVGENGIFGFSDFDRTAGVGSLTFALNNGDGAYTDSNALTGRAVKVMVYYGYLEKQISFGYIKSSKIDPSDWGDKRVYIRIVDWMNVANGKIIENVRLQEGLTIDEALPYLLAETSVDPVRLDLDIGFE